MNSLGMTADQMGWLYQHSVDLPIPYLADAYPGSSLPQCEARFRLRGDSC